MRSVSRTLLLAALVLVPVAACKQKAPPLGAYPVAAKDYLLVHNLEAPTTVWQNSAVSCLGTSLPLPSWQTAVNPCLNNVIFPVAGFTINPASAGLFNEYDSPCSGSPGCANYQCVRVMGSLYDPADGSYPSYQLRLGLKSGQTYYDMSFFSGVKFYLKMPNGGDTVLLHNFNFNLSNTTPVSDGGECDNSAKGCYNNFAVKLNYTSGWELKSFAWNEFTRETWGIPVDPPTLSGENLKRVINLEWQSKRNNVFGTSSVDFAVDEIRFY
jgi:hypothetical protein